MVSFNLKEEKKNSISPQQIITQQEVLFFMLQRINSIHHLMEKSAVWSFLFVTLHSLLIHLLILNHP